MAFFCICDHESGIGFRLAGVTTREVNARLEAQEALKEALDSKEAQIILVSEKVSGFIREEIDELIYQHRLPLVLEIPSRGQEQERKSIRQFLKEAVGVSI